MKRRATRRSEGFSMLELTIAMAILAFGMLGIAAAQMQAINQGSRGRHTSTAAAVAQQQYEHAFKLLSQTDYQGAERALTAFLDEHPSDPLAGNAKYWLGETYYVRGQYAEAAVAFAEGYQSYPDSVKAPDNLLKLGKSLAALEQTADACGTFAELLKRYGNAAPTVLKQAKSEQKRLSCK